MSITWFNKLEKKQYATIYKTNITINKTGSSYFDSNYACRVGFDQEENKIYIQPISKQDYDLQLISPEEVFVLSSTSSYTRISSTSLISHIAKITNKDYSAGKIKYETTFDENKKMLVINLNKEVL